MDTRDTRQERLAKLRQIELDAMQEQSLLRDEARRETAARIRAGECYFRCEDSFRDGVFNHGNWTGGGHHGQQISVYVKILEVIDPTRNDSNFQLSGLQFWTTSGGEVRVQTGYIAWTIDAFEMAFAGDYPEKPITEAEFLAAWAGVENALRHLVQPSRPGALDEARQW